MNYTNEINEIKKIAQEQDAIILSHYYCPPEVQEAAHFVGDSLGLAKCAAETKAKTIVFCGVHFMAETAAILCPEKKVVLVNAEAGCPMADMITGEALADRKKALPGAQVLTYVNSPASAKAESDACCTSANVVDMLRALESDTILMTPDQNLAAFAAKQVPEKKVIAWAGYCPVHHRLTAPEVLELKAKHPKAMVVAHPECRPEVLDIADFVGSTTAILKYCQESSTTEFIILTEEGVLHQLSKYPGKTYHFPENIVCEDMKKNTLAKLREALDPAAPATIVDPDIAARALASIKRMIG